MAAIVGAKTKGKVYALDSNLNYGIINKKGFGITSNISAGRSFQLGYSTGDFDDVGNGSSISFGKSGGPLFTAVTNEFTVANGYANYQAGVSIGPSAVPISVHIVHEESTVAFKGNLLDDLGGAIESLSNGIKNFFGGSDNSRSGDSSGYTTDSGSGWSNDSGDDSNTHD